MPLRQANVSQARLPPLGTGYVPGCFKYCFEELEPLLEHQKPSKNCCKLVGFKNETDRLISILTPINSYIHAFTSRVGTFFFMTLLLVCVLFAGNYINSNPGFSEEKTRVFPIPKVDDLRGIDTHLFFFFT